MNPVAFPHKRLSSPSREDGDGIRGDRSGVAGAAGGLSNNSQALSATLTPASRRAPASARVM